MHVCVCYCASHFAYSSRNHNHMCLATAERLCVHGLGVILESRNVLGRVVNSKFVSFSSISAVIINEVLCV